MTLGGVLHEYLKLRGDLSTLVRNLPTKEAKLLQTICDKRDALFMGDWACCSYLLDPRHRGEHLSPEKIRQTIDFCRAKVCPLIHYACPFHFPLHLRLGLPCVRPFQFQKCLNSVTL